MSKTTTTTTTRATSTTPRIATSTRPAATTKHDYSKDADVAIAIASGKNCACGLDRGHSAPCATKSGTAPEKVRKSRKEQATIRLRRANHLAKSLERFFSGDESASVQTEHILQTLGMLKAYVDALPETWRAKVKAPKADNDIHVGDRVCVKDNGKVKAIYGDTILASELDDMVAEKVGTKMVKCLTSVSKATVFIPLKHLSKKPAPELRIETLAE